MRIADIFVYCSNVDSNTIFEVYRGYNLVESGVYEDLSLECKLSPDVARFKMNEGNTCTVHIS